MNAHDFPGKCKLIRHALFPPRPVRRPSALRLPSVRGLRIEDRLEEDRAGVRALPWRPQMLLTFPPHQSLRTLTQPLPVYRERSKRYCPKMGALKKAKWRCPPNARNIQPTRGRWFAPSHAPAWRWE
jgi:hypothetical protein